MPAITTVTKSSSKATRKVAKKAPKKDVKKTARKASGKAAKKVKVSAQERHEMIAEAAYYLAENRGFQGGDPVADWLAGETEIDVLLSK